MVGCVWVELRARLPRWALEMMQWPRDGRITARHCDFFCAVCAQLTSSCIHVQEEGVANQRGRRTPANRMRPTSKKNQKKSIIKKEEEKKLPGTSAAHYSLVQALMTQHSRAPPPPRLTMFMKVKEPPPPPPQQQQTEAEPRWV